MQTKAGYRPDEGRDEHGRWSATGTPGSTLLVRSERIVGANSSGDPYNVHVNPRPPGMSRILGHTPYLRGVNLDGGSVALGDANRGTHFEIYDNLVASAHPLVQSREQKHFARRGDNALFVQAGPNEPHWFFDRKVGVYTYDNRLKPSQWSPGVRQALIVPGRTKSTTRYVDLKAGFDPAEPRDESGQWSGGGGGTLAWPHQVHGNNDAGEPHTVHVNPRPAEAAALGQQSDTLNALRLGHNIAVGTATHDDIFDALKKAGHHLVSTYRQRAEAKAPHNRLKLEKSRSGVIDSALGANIPFPKWQAKYGGYLNQGLVDEKHWPRALKVAFGVNAGLMAPRLFRPVARPLGLSLVPHLRLPSPVIRLSAPMNPDLKFNFDAAQPRDDHGRWTGGGGASIGDRLTGWSRRIGNRLGSQPLPSGHIPHPDGEIWINPSSARIVQFGRDAKGISSITRSGKNVVLARNVPVWQALDNAANNARSIIQTAEPDLPHAMPQTIVRAKASALGRHHVLYINPSARNLASVIKKSPDGRIRTLAIGDNLVVGPSRPSHYDMQRILQRSGHPLGGLFWQAGHPTPVSKSRRRHGASPNSEVEMKTLAADTAALAELKHVLAQIPNVTSAACEMKFVGDPDEGIIEGYASIYGNVDHHGDVVEQGAFDTSLKEFRENGKPILMYGEHSPYKQGGDPYPVGVWESVESDDTGLRVKGRLLALDHPDVRRVHTLIKAGAMPGISIAYAVNPGGSEVGRKAGEPKRRLKSVNLVSIDLTANPSNPLALIDGFKAVSAMQSMMNEMPPDASDGDGDTEGAGEPDEALAPLQEAMQECQDMIDAEQPPDVEHLMDLMECLHNCHDSLTGNAPQTVEMDHRDMADMTAGDGVKSVAFTRRQMEKRLRDGADGGKRRSRREATEIVNLFFDGEPRDEADVPDQKATDDAVTSLSAVLADFNLISDEKPDAP